MSGKVDHYVKNLLTKNSILFQFHTEKTLFLNLRGSSCDVSRTATEDCLFSL